MSKSNYQNLKSVLEADPESDIKVMKRKFRTSLTVKNKLEVIEYASQHPNATQSKIASHFGIDRTTVSKVLKKRDDILAYADQVNGSSDLMYSNLMKKGSPPPSDQQSNQEVASENQNSNQKNGSTTNSKPKPLTSKGVNSANDAEVAKLLSKKQIPKNEQVKANAETYYPDLINKCESWFMDQKLSRGAEHVANIRAFSRLISIIPLSDAHCFKILAGKVVRDRCLSWVSGIIASMQDSGKKVSTRGYELLHRFLLEEMPRVNLKLESFYCEGFTSFEADDVKRIWVKYVQPRLAELISETPVSSQLQTNGKTVWKVQTADTSLPSPNTPQPIIEIQPQSDDLSFSDSATPSPQSNVRGSRKRKMNSRPVRMVSVDVDENAAPESVDDGLIYSQMDESSRSGNNEQSKQNHPLRSLLSEPISSDMLSSHDSTPIKENIMSYSTALGSSAAVKPVTVIEIKPDGISDDEDGPKRAKQPKIGSHVNVQGYESQLLLINHIKHLENKIQRLEHAKVNRNGEDSVSQNMQNKMNDPNGNVSYCSREDVTKICAEHAKHVLDGISSNISQVVKSTADNNIANCNCDCASLKTKVENLETKLEAMHEILNKIYEATAKKDTD